jgi:3alpha(or 20beta)-hydroxysteroid dehydrogenase
MQLKDRTVLVTGGARGIGAAVVRKLAADGARIIITDVLEVEAKALADDFASDRVMHHHLDVTDPDQWRAVVTAAEERFGPVSVLINNAGIVEFGTIEEQSVESFQRVLNTNLTGAWLGMKAVLPSLRRAGDGCVVNVSSTAGLMGYGNIGAYVASKWGMRGLTKTAALEFAPLGVRVFSVHPGPIRTPMTAGMEESAISADQPIPRFGEPEEVADMIHFLVTAATYSTGTEFIVDGGVVTGVAPEVVAPD